MLQVAIMYAGMRAFPEWRISVKNRADAPIFHTQICAGAPQI